MATLLDITLLRTTTILSTAACPRHASYKLELRLPDMQFSLAVACTEHVRVCSMNAKRRYHWGVKEGPSSDLLRYQLLVSIDLTDD